MGGEPRDRELWQAIEEQSSRLTDIDEQRGRIGPSALDHHPPLVALVGLASGGDKTVARRMLRVIADFLGFRRVVPEPLSEYLASALLRIADGESADKALNLERGGRAKADHAKRNARVYEVVERIRRETDAPLRSGRRIGAIDLAARELRSQGIRLGPKRIEVIHASERADRAAVAAFFKGKATPKQLRHIEKKLSFLLKYPPRT